jgi:hypothetical protein
MTNGVFNNESPSPDTDDNQVDPQVLQKRFEDSQTYIKQLETEAAERNEALRKLEIEAEAQRLIKEAQTKAAATPPPSQEATPASREPAKSVDTDELVERVLQEQQKRTAAGQAEANAKAATDRLVETFGSEAAANKAVRDRAEALGVGTDFLLSAAQRSPSAFFELMKLEGLQARNAPAPRSDVNSVALKTHAPGVKPGTPEYYEELRKTMGADFYTPKVQQQRFKDMQAYYAGKT